MIEYFLEISTQPAWIFFAIIIMSYLLEDLAIISAAILAADQLISIPMAATAILFGIISGDMGLYLLGYLAHNHPWLREKIHFANQNNGLIKSLNSQLIKNILIIRFVPGLRFVCYTSCGLFRTPAGLFFIGVSLATTLWVVFVFTLIYALGSTSWLQDSYWKWLIAPIALLMLFFTNRHYMKKYNAADTSA